MELKFWMKIVDEISSDKRLGKKITNEIVYIINLIK